MALRIALALTMIVAMAGRARGDDRPGASVAGNVSAMNMASSTDLSFGASFAYKFNRVVGIEVEATLVPELGSRAFDDRVVIQEAVPSIAPLIFPTPRFDNAEARVVFFTNSVRVDIPTTMTRVSPFFVAGGGIAQTRTSVDYSFPVFLPELQGLLGTVLPNRVTSTSIRGQSNTTRITNSATELALTLGGGVGFALTSHVSIDADLRLFRLLGESDRNAGRFGVAARYRF